MCNYTIFESKNQSRNRRWLITSQRNQPLIFAIQWDQYNRQQYDTNLILDSFFLIISTSMLTPSIPFEWKKKRRKMLPIRIGL